MPTRTRRLTHRAKRQPTHGRAPDARYKWKVLGCVVFGIFMVVLDTTVVNVAFPTMRDQFKANLAESQWIVSLYVLSLGITTPLAGYLSDRFGMKRMYLLGLAVFTVGSLGSGVAPTLWVLTITRGIQGIGGGIALPLGTAQLFAAFPPNEQGFALGIYGVALLTAPALGPLLGGFLVDHNLWRWIFFINIPVGITGLGLGAGWLAERRRSGAVRADPLGLVTSVVGFGSILYAASIAANGGWTAPPVLIAFSIGAVMLIAFVLVELFVAEDPLLDFDLFRNLVFTNAALVGWVTVLALFGAEFLLPIYLQMLRGQTAFQTGLILVPLAIVAVIATPIAGRLYDHIGPRALVVFGFSVLCVNTWQLSKLTATTPMRDIAWLMALRGLAFGTTIQSTFTTALGTVDRMRVARGSSLVNSTRFVVQSIAVAIFATVIASGLTPRITQLQQRLQSRPVAAQRGFGLCDSTRPVSATTGSGAPSRGQDTLLRQACAENLAGFESAYRITFYFAMLALALSLFLPGWPFEWKGRGSLHGGHAAAA